jgi:hypothetical protein
VKRIVAFREVFEVLRLPAGVVFGQDGEVETDPPFVAVEGEPWTAEFFRVAAEEAEPFIDTQALRLARGFARSESKKAAMPRLSASSGSPDMEPETSRQSATGKRGAVFSERSVRRIRKVLVSISVPCVRASALR